MKVARQQVTADELAQRYRTALELVDRLHTTFLYAQRQATATAVELAELLATIDERADDGREH